jgi:hypothetical protein
VSAPNDDRLERALRDLTAALKTARAKWMVIGGIAVIARGVRRFTADIDVAVRGDEIEIRGSKMLHGSRPRTGDPSPTGVDFDLSLAWTDFEREAIA